MAHKKYVLDTSVLVHDPNSISVFVDNTVIIPITVLEELDDLKIRADGVGSNARIAIRKIDNYCKEGDTSLGIDIGNNIKLILDVGNKKDDRFNAGGKDDFILSCAYSNTGAILVSKDINMRVRAKAFGIVAQDYINDKIENVSDLFQGYQDIDISNMQIEFSENGLENVYGTVFEKLKPNECVQILSNAKKTIYRRKKNSLVPIKVPSEVWSLKSRNREQAFALDLLLDPSVSLVSLVGKAGCGKTLLAVAAALELCINQKKYARVEIYRPIQPVGNDLGYLPGDLQEKLAPWMGSIYDSLEVLMGPNYQQMMVQYTDRIKMEAITYIRGKSVNKTFMFIDECFPGEQFIRTDKSAITIKELYNKFINKQNLPRVLSFNEKTKNFEYDNIEAVVQKGKRELIEIICSNISTKCTLNHPFLTNNGWVNAEDLKIGDLIMTNTLGDKNFGGTQIKNINKLNEMAIVYDIEIKNNHNFIICSDNNLYGGLIVHNCQNLTRNEIKTILTRVGFDTKIVLTGDIEQIDNHYLDATNNGLTYVIDCFKDSDLSGHITLIRGERSPLATEASNIL